MTHDEVFLTQDEWSHNNSYKFNLLNFKVIKVGMFSGLQHLTNGISSGV